MPSAAKPHCTSQRAATCTGASENHGDHNLSHWQTQVSCSLQAPKWPSTSHSHQATALPHQGHLCGTRSLEELCTGLGVAPAALSHCCPPTSAAVVTLTSDATGVPMLVPHLRRRSYCRSCPSSAADQNMAASWGATSTLCSRLLWAPIPVQWGGCWHGSGKGAPARLMGWEGAGRCQLSITSLLWQRQ